MRCKWEQISINCGSINGIAVKRKDNHKCPLVICVHGRGETMQHSLDRYKSFTEAGIAFAAFDIHGFGSRRDESGLSFDWNTITYTTVRDYGPKFLELHLQTAQEISLWIDELAKCEWVDSDCIGVTGVSLGAFAAVHAIARDKRIKAAAMLIGGSDWIRVMEHRAVHRCGAAQEQISSQVTPEFKARAADTSLERYIDNLKNRPLLFIAGQKDNKVPVSTFHPLIDRIASVSDQKGILRFIVWPNLEHTVTEPVIHCCVQWFKTFLIYTVRT